MTLTSEFGLSTIEQIAVNAHDIERAVDFYRDKLGMKHLFSVPPNLAFFDCDGIRLMLSLPAKPEFDHPSSIIYFKVRRYSTGLCDADGTRSISLRRSQSLSPTWAHTICGSLLSATQKITCWR